MSEKVSLTVNGEARAVPEGTTVEKLLTELNISPERVVVEVNMKILKRKENAAAVLKAGDCVEIVRFVGGGSNQDCMITRI